MNSIIAALATEMIGAAAIIGGITMWTRSVLRSTAPAAPTIVEESILEPAESAEDATEAVVPAPALA